MSDPSLTIWYPRYVGSYRKHTSGLSLVEHGVYSVLLDEYYATGKPLPANAERLQRICRVFAEDEKAALQAVLGQFFTLLPDGYHNERCDQELAKRLEISEKRRIAAEKSHANRGANAGANAGASADTATATATSKLAGAFANAGSSAGNGHDRNPDETRDEILPFGWLELGEQRGVPNEQIYQSWERFKAETKYPFQRARWAKWISGERVRQ